MKTLMSPHPLTGEMRPVACVECGENDAVEIVRWQPRDTWERTKAVCETCAPALKKRIAKHV